MAQLMMVSLFGKNVAE